MSPSEIKTKMKNDSSIQQSSAEKNESFRHWYIRHLFANPIIFIIVALVTCILTVISMMIIASVGTVVNFVVLWIGDTSVGLSLLNDQILRIIILHLIRFVVLSTRQTSGSWLGWNASKRIKNEFIEHIQNKPMKFHDSVRTGEIISLATFDIGQIVEFINPGLIIIINITSALIFSVFFFASGLNAPLLFIFLIPFLIVYLLTFIRFNRNMAPVSESFMRKYGIMSTATQENINAAKVVRAFAEESYEQEKFHKYILDMKTTWRKRLILQARYFPSLILLCATSFITVLSVFLIIFGYESLTVGTLVSFDGFLLFLLYNTFDLPWGVTLYNGALAGARRIYSMENKEEREDRRKTNLELEKVKGHIIFENVTFKYPTSIKPILKNISFIVSSGQTIAIVGPTGSGKSSLTQLLLRLYEYEGTIKIDGINIRDISLESLRKSIGRIEQDIYLFPRTIRENIAFGLRNASQSDIENAARLAQAEDFILNDLPKGYETYVGEGGSQLSGGQKQRIALARTFLTDPHILILDDSTSSVDSKTEEEIVKAISSVSQGRTMFIITHRLSTIRQADMVIVLKGAGIVAKGHHSELIYTSPDYRRIYGKKADLPPLREIKSGGAS
ncbi:MAG: ABC transporter ATP-binding protein [Promethearchaeota archaeon]|jgi:ATP-binding cassette subfamily B protein